jgi:hypothetical protein
MEQFRREAKTFGPEAIPYLLEVLGGVNPLKQESAAFVLRQLGCGVQVEGNLLEEYHRVLLPGSKEWLDIRIASSPNLPPAEKVAHVLALALDKLGRDIQRQLPSGYAVAIGALGNILCPHGVYSAVVAGETMPGVSLAIRVTPLEGAVESTLLLGIEARESYSVRLPTAPAADFDSALRQLVERIAQEQGQLVDGIQARLPSPK